MIAKAVLGSLPEGAGAGPAALLSRVRREFHGCLTARRDEVFELADAVLCVGGPVRNVASLSLAPGHRRGHGALYGAVNHGRIDTGRAAAVPGRAAVTAGGGRAADADGRWE